MALKRVNLSVDEDARLLQPCWIAGGQKYSSAQISKWFAHHEIESVDVAGSCVRICNIFKDNYLTSEKANNALDAHIGRINSFRDLTRLTFGISYIWTQQVCTLLADTKQLLTQLKGNKFDWNDVKQASPLENPRKRKHILSKQTTTTNVSVSKRAKIKERQLLDEERVDYYRDMLTESQLWQTESTILLLDEGIQLSHTCTQEHVISITKDLLLTETGQDIMWNEGFGETNQNELTAFGELLPIRNSLKRKSPNTTPTGILCYKNPRLDEINIQLPNGNLENKDNMLNLNNEIPLISLSQENTEMPIPELPPPVSLPVVVGHNRRHKHKLKIDTISKLSRKMLMKDRSCFIRMLKKSTLAKTPTQTNGIKLLDSFKQDQHFPDPSRTRSTPTQTNGIQLLNSFKQDHLFPDRLRTRSPPTSVEIELITENTIRTIFGDEYSDALANKILCPANIQHEAYFPIVTTAPCTPEQDLPIECSNNNIDFDETNFDAFQVMMNLMNIWRNDSKIKAIDVKHYLKSFPDRIKAALAFSHLLTLSRDGFIKMSTKPNTLEVDAITLGAESIKLIENITNSNQIS